MEISEDALVKRGRRLSRLLRHDKRCNYDEHGWRKVSDLIENHGYTFEELCLIVATNNKKKYEFSEDMSLIRARQGHSVQVDVELAETVPPAVLYHGTAKQFLDSIREKGILKEERLHVHLSDTVENAVKVGKRHGEPVVLKIDAQRMSEEGVSFFLSRNDVWLTEFVDKKYIVDIIDPVK